MRINAVRLSGNIPMHYIKFDTVVLKQFCKNSAQGGFFGGASTMKSTTLLALRSGMSITPLPVRGN